MTASARCSEIRAGGAIASPTSKAISGWRARARAIVSGR